MADHYKRADIAIEDKVTELQTRGERFQSIGERAHPTEQVVGDAQCQIHEGKFKTNWKGINMLKDCRDMAVYQTMLSEIKPLTVIELGTYTGGSSVWFADLLKVMDIPGHVYTVDISNDYLHPTAVNHSNVTFLNGDVTNIDQVLPQNMLKCLPHPWLIIEDVHINTLETLEYFAKHMEVGDYFSIEDTSPHIGLGGWGKLIDVGVLSYINEDDECDLEGTKHKSLVNFLTKRNEEFKVDSLYTDFFGFNATNSWDGYIKKVK